MWTIASFELRSRLRLLSSWVYFSIFFTLAALWIAAAGGLFKEANVSFGSGKIFINSPFAIAQTISFLGMFGLTVMAAIMGRAVQQDYEYRTQSFFFTAPINKWQYLSGRFLGALGVTLIVFSSIGLGAFFATKLPGMDHSRLGPNRFIAYIVPYLIVLLPNAMLIGGIFFNVAATTRKMLPVYMGSVVLLLGWLLSSQLMRDMENKTIAALIDPFGSRAMSVLSEYWTVSERNTRLLPFEGVLLWNRLLWLGVSMAITGVAAWRFSFAKFLQEPVGKDDRANEDDRQDARKAASSTRIEPVRMEPRAAWKLIPSLVGMYFRETVKNVYFGVLVLAGVLFMILSSTTVGDIFGTSTWPLTFEMLSLLSGTFTAFVLIIIAFYGGELVFREREARLDQIIDATPVPTWIPMVSKLLALMLVPVLLQGVLMMCGIGIQIAKGYTRFELGLYVHELFGIKLIDYWLLCALAITIHSVVNHKYLGHFVMTVFYIVTLFSTQLGLEHNLYKFGSYAEVTYSDLNGYGHFLFRARVFQAYWTMGALVLLVLAYLLWTRGTTTGLKERLRVARARLGSATITLGAVGKLGFILAGGYIYYNTNILNHYKTTFDTQARRASYEKTYKRYAAEPQPKITAVRVDVELFPNEQRVRMRGTYELMNKNQQPVTTVMFGFATDEVLRIHKLEISTANELVEDNSQIGVRRYQLKTPLLPGEKTTVRFDLENPTLGFKNEGSNTAVVYNGSFLNSRVILPTIGYQEGGELQRDEERKKHGLLPKERMRDRDDPSGLQINALSPDSDWITFETTISTEADQIAIAPGYLQREWVEGGRHHYAYKMDAPILNFFAYQSARYAVKRDVWHDAKNARDVQLEIYYQPGHAWNLDRMMSSSKAALAYCSEHFSPYQYRQFRIIEFPRYESFAQSFPNTIPYSEAIGFIARVRDDDDKDIDYPYYVTAHEAAHQWWGHQVSEADVQGSTLLIETMAQYSALMVMKHKYGEGKMRRFLAYELDRYLQGRAFEQKKELPLSRVENQPYIHYRKGSLIMYALQDYIGEDKVNQAVKKFLDQVAFKGPPYPNSPQLVSALRAVTPPDLAYLIDDMFEQIVLYDNRATSARAKQLPDGKYQVTIGVKAKKLRADALGKEDQVALNDLIDIGVVDAHGEPLLLRREKLTQEDTTFTLIVDKKPVKAGIDPLNKLIDRKPRDNVKPVEFD